MDFEDATGSLWLSGSHSDGIVYEVDPTDASIRSTLDPTSSLGIIYGADALALDPTTGNIALFSGFGDSAGGLVTQSGTVLGTYPAYSVAFVGGAAFDASGQLWTSLTGSSFNEIRRLDPVTGTILETVPIVGSTGQFHSANFDPVSGNLFLYNGETGELVEVDVTTGTVLSSLDMEAVIGIPLEAAAGFAFDATGDEAYFTNVAAPGTLWVLSTPEPGTRSLLLLAVAVGAILHRVRRRSAPARRRVA